MPELPEVEGVCRVLNQAGLDAPLRDLWRSELALRTGEVYRDERLSLLTRLQPAGFKRRGKFILWSFEGGVTCLIHLGMSGQLLLGRTDDDEVPAHTHVEWRFADGRCLRFVDPRRFGAVIARRDDEVLDVPAVGRLGPEPLEAGFGASAFERVAGSARPLHAVLLDDRVVAGVGNIYAQEALFLAGLRPSLRASRTPRWAWRLLAKQVVAVLRKGVRLGGTTFRDYRDPWGARGRAQERLWVYGLGGEPCRRCETRLRATTVAGRGVAYCPVCQPARPRRPHKDKAPVG